jgi:hypothetical protein
MGQPSPDRQDIPATPQQSLSPGGVKRSPESTQRLQPGTMAHLTGTEDPSLPAVVKGGETTAQETMVASTQAAEGNAKAQKTKAGSTDDVKAPENASETTTAEATVAAEGVPALSTMAATRKVDTLEAAAQGQVNFPPPAPAKKDDTEEGPHKTTEVENKDNTETEAPSTARVEATEDTGDPHTGPTPVNRSNQEPNRKRMSSSPSHTENFPVDTEHTQTENTGHQGEPPEVLRKPLRFPHLQSTGVTTADQSPHPQTPSRERESKGSSISSSK